MCDILKFRNFKELSIKPSLDDCEKLIEETNILFDSDELNDYVVEYHDSRLSYIQLILQNSLIHTSSKKCKLKLIKKAA